MTYRVVFRDVGSWLALLTTLSLAPVDARAQLIKREDPKELSFKFIGNASVRVTDGTKTLVTDFPYRSGAGGYMKYDMEDFDPVGEVICLITHRHLDHWDGLVYRHKLWTIIGPPGMLRLYQNFHVFEVKPEMEYEGIRIESEQTRHLDVEHFSYLVTWHGVRIYFTGDTERERHVLAATDLDVAFVTPWILQRIHEQGKRIDADRVVVYHHKRGQRIVPYEGVIVPEQNDTFTIPLPEAASRADTTASTVQ